MSSMFCYQCEQTAKETGCASFGTCGKDPETSALQDLIVHACKGICQYASPLAKLDIKDAEADDFLLHAIFSTLTNVNFDPGHLEEILAEAGQTLARMSELFEREREKRGCGCKNPVGPALWRPAADLNGLIAQGERVGIEARIQSLGHEVSGLQEMLIYGVKGMAAYAWHARMLKRNADDALDFLKEALCQLAEGTQDIEKLLGLNLACGKATLQTIEALDVAHNEVFGAPEPTEVRVTPVKGKAILMSGHDLADLKALLEQTEGRGVNVYTHGEMLPAHSYPELKKYKHLVGNYGGAWQDQREEFEAFPGTIVMNTNCLQKPKETYSKRIFTCNSVGWPGVERIRGQNYGPAIEGALSERGFESDAQEEKRIMVGFGHGAALGVADKVIGAVKSGDIRRFFLIGGCDGAKTGRDYYTDFAQNVPDDCVILTLACGKYRFNKLDFGDIGGIPRLLDMGQCNDAYSAIKVAQALAQAFDCGVNDLPLSLIVSWYEQKAVAILLALLHLGIRNIRLGPSLPAFVSPAVLKILNEKFNLMPIGDPGEDLAACLRGEAVA